MDIEIFKNVIDLPDWVSVKGQLYRLRTTIITSGVIALLVIAGIYGISMLTGKPISWFTRDPAALTYKEFYLGMQSNLGVMCWSATTAICLLGFFLLNRQKDHRQDRRFLFASGLLCLVLSIDDCFMFHEEFLPKYLHLHQVLVYFAYCLIFGAYMILFWRKILSTDYLLLVLAFCFLGLSVATDVWFDHMPWYKDRMQPTDSETFFEDGFKFLGIVFWLTYFFHTSAQMIRQGLINTGDLIEDSSYEIVETIRAADEITQTTKVGAGIRELYPPRNTSVPKEKEPLS